MKAKSSRRLHLAATTALAVCFSAAMLTGFAHAGTTWDGGGSSADWGDVLNWDDDSTPPTGSGVVLTFAGTTGLTSNNNYTAWDDFGSLIFSSGAGAFALTGNAIDLFGKIENYSSNLQTISLADIGTGSMSGSFIEMNPVDGNLLITSANIYLGNNQLRVYGNNGNTLTFGASTVISGTGATFALNENSNVVFQSAHTYTGDTFINAGRLELASGASLATSQIQLGDTTGSAAAELRLTQAAGGFSSDRGITVRAGSSGTKTISASNTSGSNTLSGAVTLNNGLTLNQSSTGTLALTGAISTGAFALTKTGTGIVSLTNSSNAYTGGTSVNDGTLSFANGALGTTGAITMGGGALQWATGNTQDISSRLTLVAATSATFDTNGNNVTLANALAGATSASLVKTGAGILTLSGANSYSGGATVNQGTLRLGNAAALGTSSLVTVASGATLDLAGFAAGRPLEISGTGVGGAAALHNSSTTTGASVSSLKLNADATIGNLAVTSGSPDWNKMLTVSGLIDLNGKKLTISTGAVNTGGGRNITSGDIEINSGGILASQNGGSQTAVTGTITINSGGKFETRDFDNTAMTTVHDIVLNGGTLSRATLQNNNGGGGGTILKNNITVDATNGGTITSNAGSFSAGIFHRLAGSLSGSGTLAMNGSAGVEFRGDTSGYTGTATATNGTVSFNPSAASQTFNGILAGSRPVQKIGSNTTIFAGANTYTGATTVSAGTLVLSGANTGNTAVTVASGATLGLDYATQDNSKLHDSSVLTLSGGTVDLSGATGSHTEAVGSTTLSAGTFSSITRTGGNSAVLNLNTITRNAGATLNFGASGIARTDNLNNSGGIIGTWATIGGGEFAVNSTNSADGLITAPNYDLTSVALDTASNYTDRHMSVDSSQTPDAAITPHTLTFNTAGAYTLSLTGTNTIKGGGIAVTSAVGNNASTLTGGFLQAGTAGGDLLVNQNNTANILTIGSVIQNNTSASTLTKSGAGTLVLSGANTFTGQTNIAAGTLRFGVANALATSAVVMSAGTLDLGGFNPSILGLRSDGATAPVVTNSDPGTGTNTLSITGGWWGNYSGVIQDGATAKTAMVVSGTNGRISWAGTNTFTGGLTINGNGVANGADTGVILGISSDAALGAASNVVTLNNGGALFNATSNTSGWLASTTPTLAASRSIVMGSGVGGVFRVWGSSTFTVNSVISGSGALTKTDGGTLVLSGANTYTGVTTVSTGTIRLNNGQALGSLITGRPVTQVVVASGGAVDLNAIGATYGYTIAGTGVGSTGALTNSSTTAISNGSAQTSNIRLSANASIGGTGNWALLTNSYNPTSLDLGGFTLTKAGANTISLVSTTTTAGTIQVSGGTLAFGVTNGGTGVTGSASALTLDNTAGVSLSLVRDSSIGSLAGGGSTGGGVNLNPGTARTLTIGALNTNTSYAGVISGTSGVITKVGTGTQTFSGANTYTGATNINGGTLALDYATQNNSKLSDTAALTFGAGSATLSLAGGSHTEVVASTTLAAGASANITRPSGTSVVQLGTITVNTNAALNLSAAGIATTNNLNNAAGMLGAWATVGNDWAQSAASGTNIPITAFSAYTDYTRLNLGTQIIVSDTAHNARIIDGTGSAANLTLAAATTNINTLNQSATGGATTIAMGTNTLRLGTTGGILAGPGVSALTIGSAVNQGFLSAGGSTTNTAGTLYLTNNSSNVVTLNSPVINNGTGAVTLVKTGSGRVDLAGNTGATFSGGTFVNQGELRIVAPTTSATYGTLGTGAVTVNTGATLRFFTGSTSNTITYTNAINLNNATLIGDDGSHVLSGAVTLTGSNTINVVYADKNLTLSGAVGGSGGFTKTGANSLILSGSNNFTGGITITGGRLQANLGTTAGSRTMLGSGTVTANTGTTLRLFAGSTTNAMTIANAINLNSATLVIEDAVQTLSGAMALTGTNTVNVVYGEKPATLSGVISGTGGLTKSTGTGGLTLSGNNTYTGATTVSAGRLNVTGSNASTITFTTGTTLGGEGSTAGGLTFNTGSTISLDPNTSGSFNSSGAVNFAGATTAVFESTPTSLGVNAINIVGYGTLNVPNLANLTGPAGYRGGMIANDTVNSKVTFNFTSGTRTWNRTTAGTWNTLTDTSWLEGDTLFATGDAVVFDDTATNGAVTLAGTLNPSAVTFNNTNTAYALTGSGVIAGTTGLTKNGSGTVSISTANTYTGATVINAGSLNIQHASALGSTVAGTTVASGAALEIQGGITTAAEALDLNGTGITATSGALRNVAGNNTYAGTINIASASTIYAETGTMLTTSGLLTLANTLTKTGDGTLRFINYSGSTAAASSDIIINAGTVEFASGYFASNPFGSQTLTITVNAGGILRTSTSHAFGGSNLNGGSWGQVFVNGGTIQINGSQYISAGTVSGQGRTVLNGGAITGTADIRGLNSTITTLASATTSTISNAGGINLQFGGITFAVADGAAATDLLVSTVISSTNGVTKSGAGLASFSGDNTYTGATNVNAGTLLINGNSSAATGAVTVASAATLGGTGTVGGAITVSGSIAPGSTGIGTLNAGNNVTWNSGNDWKFELSSTDNTSDWLAITGQFIKGTGGAGAFVFDFMGSTPVWGETYTLATFASTDFAEETFFSHTNLGPGSYSTSYFTLNGTNLQFTAIPEPGTALAGLLLTAGLLRRRRKVEG